MSRTETILTSEEMAELQMLVDEIATCTKTFAVGHKLEGTADCITTLGEKYTHEKEVKRIAHILGLEVGE